MTNPFIRGDSGSDNPWGRVNRPTLKEQWNRFMRSWRYSWRNNGPNITQSIVIANIFIFLLVNVLSIWPRASFMFSTYFGLLQSPASLYMPWTLVTSAFMHTGFMHIAMNMLSLYFVGKEMENLLGHWSFLAMYVISAIGGSVFFLAWYGTHYAAALGASGAIYGLFAAWMTVYRRTSNSRTTFGIILCLFILPIFFMPTVAWQAHLGGFLTGGVLSLLMMHGLPFLRYSSINKRMLVYGIFMLIVLIAIWLTRLFFLGLLH